MSGEESTISFIRKLGRNSDLRSAGCLPSEKQESGGGSTWIVGLRRVLYHDWDNFKAFTWSGFVDVVPEPVRELCHRWCTAGVPGLCWECVAWVQCCRCLFTRLRWIRAQSSSFFSFGLPAPAHLWREDRKTTSVLASRVTLGRSRYEPPFQHDFPAKGAYTTAQEDIVGRRGENLST